MAARGLGKGLDAMIPKTIPAIQEDKIVQQEIEKSDGKATETCADGSLCQRKGENA